MVFSRLSSLTPYDYNTTAGIAKQILEGGLEGLNRVIEARSAFYRRKKGDLSQFVILGRFVFDTCANVGRISEFGSRTVAQPADVDPKFPTVMRLKPFFGWAVQYFYENASDEELAPYDWDNEGLSRRELCQKKATLSHSHGSSAYPPSNNRLCMECQRGWDIENCHDLHVQSGFDWIDVSQFVGQTLGNVRTMIDASSKIFRQEQPFNNNDGPILRGTHEDHEQVADITADYIIQSGDLCRGYVWDCYHRQCWQDKLDNKTRDEFSDVLHNAGFAPFEMEKTTNRYGSGSYNGTWWKIRWDNQELTMGWRKRVIDISWDTPIHIVTSDDVTKSSKNVHAWNYEKATEYLKTIKERLSSVPV